MKIDYEFTVGVPVDRAWKTMLDLERIAPCLPGASLTEETGDGGYAGTMRVGIGPINVGYEGTVKFEEADEANHRAVLHATGRERRGQGTATATITPTLHDEGNGSTRVSVETDMQLTGRAAQFGRGIAQDVATKLLDEFAACLERELSADDGGPRSVTADGNTAAAGAAANGGVTGGDPVAAGATVEGAVVAGPSPAEATAGAQTSGIQQPTTHAPPRYEDRRERESLDPGAADQQALLERLAPLLAGAGVLLTLLWLFLRRR